MYVCLYVSWRVITSLVGVGLCAARGTDLDGLMSSSFLPLVAGFFLLHLNYTHVNYTVYSIHCIQIYKCERTTSHLCAPAQCSILKNVKYVQTSSCIDF